MDKADGIPVAMGYVTEEKDITPSCGQLPTAYHAVSYCAQGTPIFPEQEVDDPQEAYLKGNQPCHLQSNQAQQQQLYEQQTMHDATLTQRLVEQAINSSKGEIAALRELSQEYKDKIREQKSQVDDLKSQVARLEAKVNGKEEELRLCKIREDVSRAKIYDLEKALEVSSKAQVSSASGRVVVKGEEQQSFEVVSDRLHQNHPNRQQYGRVETSQEICRLQTRLAKCLAEQQEAQISHEAAIKQLEEQLMETLASQAADETTTTPGTCQGGLSLPCQLRLDEIELIGETGSIFKSLHSFFKQTIQDACSTSLRLRNVAERKIQAAVCKMTKQTVHVFVFEDREPNTFSIRPVSSIWFRVQGVDFCFFTTHEDNNKVLLLQQQKPSLSQTAF